MSEIEQLVADLERLPEEAREKARALLEETLALHREGLARLLDLGGATLREAAANDALVSALLALHDLHPRPVEDRVRTALERSRASLGVAGVTAELLSVTDGVVRVRVRGKHAEEARDSIADTLWSAAPDAAEILIDAVGPVVPLRIHA
jgi:hypothetical protein